MPRFTEVQPKILEENPWNLIGSDWALVTAGNMRSWNTMTASWGGFGVLWNRDVVFAFVRPVRHTYSFMEQESFFTLSFFDESRREALRTCGSVSGRDVDKAAVTGLVPFEAAPGAVSFEDARLILVCRKIYSQDIDPARFIDADIDGNYPAKDYHRMYTGEIVKALRREPDSA